MGHAISYVVGFNFFIIIKGLRITSTYKYRWLYISIGRQNIPPFIIRQDHFDTISQLQDLHPVLFDRFSNCNTSLWYCCGVTGPVSKPSNDLTTNLAPLLKRSFDTTSYGIWKRAPCRLLNYRKTSSISRIKSQNLNVLLYPLAVVVAQYIETRC